MLKKISFVIFLMITVNSLASIIYVKYDAKGLNNGASWDNAYNNLQVALDSANYGDQIWVANGTYTPSKKIGGKTVRFNTFQLKNGVSIFGSFTGTENDPNQRDLQKNRSFLSGSVGFSEYDKSYHVFYHPKGLNLDSTAVLDGFEICNGNADGDFENSYGSAMYNYECSPKIINIIFQNNVSKNRGGAIYNENCHIYINLCKFVNNISNDSIYGGAAIFNNNCDGEISKTNFAWNFALKRAGAIYNFNTNCYIDKCTFIENSSLDRGGAIVNDYYSNSIIKSCRYWYNESGWGGGIYNLNSSPQIINCMFLENLAYGILNDDKNYFGGGAIGNDYSSEAKIINCTIVNNKSEAYGGGIFNYRSNIHIYNSIIYGNYSYSKIGENIYFDKEGNSELFNSCINNGDSSIFGENFTKQNCIYSDPKINPQNKRLTTLLSNSECIDAGNNEFNYEEFDLRGSPFKRKLNKNSNDSGRIDIGAFEFYFGVDSTVNSSSIIQNFNQDSTYPIINLEELNCINIIFKDETEITDIKLVDLKGCEVNINIENINKKSYNLKFENDLISGFYILLISTQNKNYNCKFIKF